MRSCKREGCPSPGAGAGEFCSYTCVQVDRKIEQALHLARKLGPGNPISHELQQAAVAAGDSYSELLVWMRVAQER